MGSEHTMKQERKATFTPRPWKVGETTGSGAVRIHSVDRPPQLIAEVVQSDRTHTAEANASLVAAAPDLYEALRALLTEHDFRPGQPFEYPPDHYVNRARAALAQAEGRSA